MKKYRLKKKIKNKLLLTLLVITTIATLLGILYISLLSNKNIELIKKTINIFFKNINNINYNKAFIKSFSTNILSLIFIWILGISIIGIPLIILILVLKSFSLGFSIGSILYIYKLKGIFIAIIYIVPLLINLFSIIYLSYYGIIFSKNLNSLLFTKKDISFKNIMKKYTRILLTSLIIITISSIIEIYIVPSILKLLQI